MARNINIRVNHFSRSILLLFLLLAAAPSCLYGQSISIAENQKIETLIKQVGELKEAKFIRNGSAYEVSTAVRFLRGKWDANAGDVRSARDFVDKVASTSGTSGKPYIIRFKDGREIRSRDYLLGELQRLES